MSVSGADGRVEPAGSGTAADGGFEVVHVAADGTERRASLAALAAVRLEDGRPVRSFLSYRGQRNYPGWYWSATMGRRIGFESWVERDHLVALDFDLRWLAGYRHPRCHDEPVAGRLREAFARPRALMDGAEMAGDPLATLPVLFHLMWRHELAADLSLVLSDRSILRSAAAGGGHG